jgi:hypothetical protein
MIATKIRPFGLSILAVAALAGAGCGGGESEAESAKDEVESAVKEYAAALKDKDYDKACDSITGPSRELVESQGGQGGGKCPEILKQVADAGQIGDIPDEDDVEFSSVKVTGDRATVKIKGGDQPAKLKKEDDEWKFDFAPQQ